jgi:hypothetical protein
MKLVDPDRERVRDLVFCIRAKRFFCFSDVLSPAALAEIYELWELSVIDFNSSFLFPS